MSNLLTCASFFAGIGGIDKAFEYSGFTTIYANEFDINAGKIYNQNNNIIVDPRDIRTIKAAEIPDFDILLAGFPCQPFSIAGKREGFNDSKNRGNLFNELIRIVHDKQPKVLFFENVKNLVTHNNGETFETITDLIKTEGYTPYYKIMNTANYGNLPQNRERIYIVAFRNDIDSSTFEFPNKIPLVNKLHNFIDFETKIDDKYYYTEDTMKHYKLMADNITKSNTVYQFRRSYIRENKSELCPTLTASMGMGGHNVPIVYTKHGIRKITPVECLKLNGFPDYCINGCSNSQLYKMSGNTVSIPVISRIAYNIQNTITK